jgi:hypothetical protein
MNGREARGGNRLKGSKVLNYFVLLTIMIGLSACQATEPTMAVPSAIHEEKASPDLMQKMEVSPTVDGIRDVTALIPAGWQLLVRESGPVKVEGDLNQDGIQDVAVVIDKIETKTGEAPERALLIAFGNKDHTYTRSIVADKAILKADEGGVWGDPLDSIAIDRGSVLVNFYGGSNFRWYGKYRFRFQNDDWYLIGATVGSYFTGTTTPENGDEEDYNLLTGDYVKRVVDDLKDEKPTSHTITGNIGTKKLLKLSDYVAGGSKDQFLK